MQTKCSDNQENLTNNFWTSYWSKVPGDETKE